jgi:hypothetical protein
MIFATLPYFLQEIQMKAIITAASVIILGAASLAANAATNSGLIGESAPAATAGRTIVLDANTKWANVDHGETVRFVVNGQEFAVTFDGVAEDVDLRQLAPAGALDHKVEVYVADSFAG